MNINLLVYSSYRLEPNLQHLFLLASSSFAFALSSSLRFELSISFSAACLIFCSAVLLGSVFKSSFVILLIFLGFLIALSIFFYQTFFLFFLDLFYLFFFLIPSSFPSSSLISDRSPGKLVSLLNTPILSQNVLP